MVLKSKSNKSLLDNVCTYNKALMKVTKDKLLTVGRQKISTRDELKKFPMGSNISYKSISGNFRLAGWLTDINDDNFMYTPDFEHKIRVKFSRVKRMWVGSVYETDGDVVSIYPTKKIETKFPVIVNGVIVHYCRNEYYVKVYKASEKFDRIIEWCNYFCPNSTK
jgi:hypothetical protein